jgi:uncharacterized cupin superfamily protein
LRKIFTILQKENLVAEAKRSRLLSAANQGLPTYWRGILSTLKSARIPPGKSVCPFHSHSAQWEFYHVISGQGIVRHDDGFTEIEPGDSFIFQPGEAHQLTNNGSQDLIIMIVADNPIGESCYYPDSQKWLVRSPDSRLMRSDPIDYYDGEE